VMNMRSNASYRIVLHIVEGKRADFEAKGGLSGGQGQKGHSSPGHDCEDQQSAASMTNTHNIHLHTFGSNLSSAGLSHWTGGLYLYPYPCTYSSHPNNSLVEGEGGQTPFWYSVPFCPGHSPLGVPHSSTLAFTTGFVCRNLWCLQHC